MVEFLFPFWNFPSILKLKNTENLLYCFTIFISEGEVEAKVGWGMILGMAGICRKIKKR